MRRDPADPTDPYIPEPTIVMLGCQPWPPKLASEPFHAPANSRVLPSDRCPVCDRGINAGDHRTYCGWEDRSERSIESRCRSARIGHQSRGRIEDADREAARALQKRRKHIRLPESERRRIWLGCKGDHLSSRDEVSNRAKIGRDWLRSIGQEPDWTLVLDKRGNVVGRLEVPCEPV